MGVRSVLSYVNKKCAYCTASILCFLIFVLMLTACALPWWKDKTEGILITSTNVTNLPLESSFEYEIREFLFYLEFDLEGRSIKECQYADGNCNAIVGKQWDLNEYEATYASIMVFAILSMISVIILGILVQVLCWAASSMPPIVTKILFITAVVVSVVLLVFLVIDWCLLFNHAPMAREATDVADSWCDSFDDEEDAGFLCTWNGQRSTSTFSIKEERFLGARVRKLEEVWGPAEGWILCTISLGMAGWVFLFIVGWRPIIKS